MELKPKHNHLDASASLIECMTCHTPIAALAEECPKCAAPNAWQHPHIEAFITQRATIPTTRKFNYWNNKTSIWGETKARAPWWAKAVAIMIGLPGFAYSMLSGQVIWLPALLGFGLAIFLHFTAKKEWFKADLKAKTWASNNEKFWRPVRELLKM